jgi:hypothetical protein
MNSHINTVTDAIERAASNPTAALQILLDALAPIDTKGAVGIDAEVVYGAVEIDEDGEIVSDGESYRDRLWVASGDDQLECTARVIDGCLVLRTECDPDAGWELWAREAVNAVMLSNGAS